MNRRQFLGHFLFLSVAAALPQELVAAAEKSVPDLKVGIVSDIHLSRPSKHKSQGAIDTFVRTLEFFKEQSADAIILAGDLTNGGTADELRVTVECWERVFGGLSSGPVKIFVTGNHENNYSKEAKERWREILQESDESFFLKRVRGYTFIGAHWAAWNDAKSFRAFLKAHEADLARTKPFFYVQHAHPQHTCYGDWIWHRPDGGPTDKVLAAYPNAVAFSGHTHYSLTDERSIWQGAFTSIGTASLRWLSMPEGRENGSRKKGIPTRMQNMPSCICPAQGMIMKVWNELMVFERYDLSNMEKLGEDWEVRCPDGRSEEPEYSFAARKRKSSAPEFPKDATITLKESEGNVTSARGKSEKEEQLILTFPAAVAADDLSRVFDYEVTIEVEENDVITEWRKKRVFQHAVTVNAKRTPAKQTCVFAKADLPPCDCRFAVTPMNAFGKRGRTIYLTRKAEVKKGEE